MAKDKRIMVIGLGRFGTAIVEDLWEAGVDVVVVDSDEDTVERMKDKAGAAFVGDATEPDVLEGVGAADMSTVVLSFGRYFEASVLCVTSLHDLGVPYIVARAETERQARILKTVGAHRVVEIERDMGRRLANDLIAPVTQELLEFAQHYRVIPWSARGPLVGKALQDARLRQDYQIHVLGYRRWNERTPEGRKPRIHIPGPHYEIREGDTLLIAGDEENVNRFVEELGEG
ncbi:MAG: potassium channel family protein [Myxococcota bacterium]